MKLESHVPLGLGLAMLLHPSIQALDHTQAINTLLSTRQMRANRDVGNRTRSNRFGKHVVRRNGAGGFGLVSNPLAPLLT